MSFEQRLADTARNVEDSLEALLRGAAHTPPRLEAAMLHAVMAGGKRIRPFLVLESATLFGAPHEAAMPAALALELVHCYSLVHDDLPTMDNDELRRGKPTVWKAFDDWTAILAGDSLLTLAFEVLTEDAQSTAPAIQLALTRALARASGRVGMVGGQCLDLEADKLGEPARPSVAHIDRLQAMKTGALFRFACEAGALLGTAPAADVAAMARFGDTLGAAFQLADDLLDVEGDAATVGKATAKDAAAGKATFIGLSGVPAARARLAQIEAAAMAELARFGPRAEVLREALRFAINRRK